MGNCLKDTPKSLINIDHRRVKSELLPNTVYDLETWHKEIKDALMISSGYSSYNDHTVILDYIISYISFSTPIFIADKCRYIPKKSKFQLIFNSNKLLNVNSPKYKIDLELNKSIHTNNCSNLFNVFVSKSGYIFISLIEFNMSASSDEKTVIYSKIYENQRNQIYIQSPWKIYTKWKIESFEDEWQHQSFIISNYYGLIQCFRSYSVYGSTGSYKMCIIDPINHRKYWFEFQSNFTSQIFFKIFTKKELVHIGLLNEENTKHTIEYLVVCGYQKKKNILNVYELPTGNLTKTKHIKNINGSCIIYFNINVENQCLMFVTASNKNRLWKLKLNSVKIMKYNIIKQQILISKSLSNSMVPKIGHWRCESVSHFMKNSNEDWELTLNFGDGASEPSGLEIRIIFDKQLNEKQRIKGPKMYLGMFGPSKESGIDWLYHHYPVSFDPPI